MKQITPYLFFDGNCKEAMTFYKDVFGGELSMMKVGESPEAEKMPDSKDRMLHAAIMVNGKLMLMASDTMMPGQTAEMGEGVYNTVICDTKEEIETLFSRLSEGGKVNMPLEEAFFGWFGSLTDKFGVKWMLEFDKPEKHQ
jgi:PhnB protein